MIFALRHAFYYTYFMQPVLPNDVSEKNAIIEEYLVHLKNKEFPCVAARQAVARQQVKCMVAGNMACPKDDEQILQFIYSFVDDLRNSADTYHSAAVIFKAPAFLTEEMFDTLLWTRLQALADIDAARYDYDKRVDADTSSAKFSFSIKEEAFYVIGLHANSNRASRQFKYPVLVFNPHAQFEQLRQTTSYEKMKNIVRKRDIAYSGSVNPMLEDFGKSSEVYQYSGRKYDKTWACPLKINHAATKHNSST